MTNIIHIVMAADDNYAMHIGVAIRSILYNRKEDDIIFFHILNGDIRKETQRIIDDMVTKSNAYIEYISIDHSLFAGKILNITESNHITLATYYRLLIPSLIHADRCIYMDCDMICRSSLRSLWEISLGSCIAAAVRDIDEDKQSARLGLKRYFNAGLLLMDLEAMRRENTQQSFFRFLEEHYERIVMHDQDVLNCILDGRILELAATWNCQIAKTHKCRKSGFYALGRTANILHFIGHRKPWHWKCKAPYRKEYWKYLEKTPWKKSPSETMLFFLKNHFYNLLNLF